METRCGSLLFTSKFDSGNLARVEKVTRDDEEEGTGNYFTGPDPRPDYEFQVWTTPDCAGTPYENGNRSWFHFGVRGGSPGKLLKISIMNMNKQGKLYSQGHSPFTKTVPGKPKWDRIRDRPTWENVDGQFILTFTHRFLEFKGATTYFAFCFPWSYQESQDQMAELDEVFKHCRQLTPASPPDSIYYHREFICNSLENHRMDLLTITSCHGMTNEEEPRFDCKLFTDFDTPRCKVFKDKKVFFLSSRVHPGETPASFVYNGFLEFILRQDDPRAKQLRRQYVFKLVPMLNPDGCLRGNYRTDTRGVNLNRMYLDPDFDMYPTIYAAKSLLVFYHLSARICKDGDKDIKINWPTADAKGAQNNQGEVYLKEKKQENAETNQVKSTNNTFSFVYSQVQDSFKSENQINVNNNTDSALSNHTDTSATGASAIYDPYGFGRDLKTPSMFADPSSFIPSASLMYPDENEDEDANPNQTDNTKETPIQQNMTSSEVANTPVQAQNSDMGSMPLDGGDLGSVPLDGKDSVMDDDTEHLGNEGSEDEDDGPAVLGGNPNATAHLRDPKLLQILPHESGIAFYVDLHGHASKRGCFIYGNYLAEEDKQVENLLFPKLISLNTAHFDFTGCNFTEKNMYTKDKRDGQSKEGSGRVGMYKAIGIIHSYTLECNYNTGRMVNPVPPAYGDDGRATPPPLAGFPPKYTMAHYEEVGKAVAIAALDMTETNPWSRVTLSEHASLHGVRDWVRRYLRSLRGAPKLPRNMARAAARTSSMVATATSNPSFHRQGMNRINSKDSMSSTTSSVSSRGPSNSNVTYNKGTFGTAKRPVNPPPMTRKELGPVREGSRFDKNKPRTIASNPTVNCVSIATVNMTMTTTTLTTTVSNVSMTTTATDIRTGLKPTTSNIAMEIMQKYNIPYRQQMLSHNMAGEEPTNPTKSNVTEIRKKQSHPSEISKLNPKAASDSVIHRLYFSHNEEGNPSGNVHTVNDLMANMRLKKHITGEQAFQRSNIISQLQQQFHSTGEGPNCTSPQSRPNSNESSALSVEEEKLQQLQKLSDNLPIRHKPPGHLRTSNLDMPMSDPPKRRFKKVVNGKRRSASHSPKSIQGQRKMSSETDSEVEKKRVAKRKLTARGMRKPAPAQTGGTNPGGNNPVGSILGSSNSAGDLSGVISASGCALQLSPRPTTARPVTPQQAERPPSRTASRMRRTFIFEKPPEQKKQVLACNVLNLNQTGPQRKMPSSFWVDL